MSARRSRVAHDRGVGHTRAPGLDVAAFNEQVMASIDALPQPTPSRAFARALRSGAWGDGLAALVVAWHLATVRGWSVAPRVRARSMALVLAVATVLATGSLVAAAAVQMAVPPRHDRFDPLTSLPGAMTEPVTSDPDMDQPGERPAGGPGPLSVEPVGGDSDDPADGATEDEGPDDADDGEDEGQDGSGGEDDADEADDADDADRADDSDDRSDGDPDAGDADDEPDGGSDRDGGGSDENDDAPDGDDGGD